MNVKIGRELKVSDLQMRGTVVLVKPGRFPVAVRVLGIKRSEVLFFSTARNIVLCVSRCGEGLEQITDDAASKIAMHEYLEDLPQ